MLHKIEEGEEPNGWNRLVRIYILFNSFVLYTEIGRILSKNAIFFSNMTQELSQTLQYLTVELLVTEVVDSSNCSFQIANLRFCSVITRTPLHGILL